MTPKVRHLWLMLIVAAMLLLIAVAIHTPSGLDPSPNLVVWFANNYAWR